MRSLSYALQSYTFGTRGMLDWILNMVISVLFSCCEVDAVGSVISGGSTMTMSNSNCKVMIEFIITVHGWGWRGSVSGICWLTNITSAQHPAYVLCVKWDLPGKLSRSGISVDHLHLWILNSLWGGGWSMRAWSSHKSHLFVESPPSGLLWRKGVSVCATNPLMLLISLGSDQVTFRKPTLDHK